MSSLFLDGVNEYVTMGDVSALQFERTNTFSLSAWIRTTKNTAAQQIVGKQESSTGTNPARGYSFHVINPTGQLRVRIVGVSGTSDITLRTVRGIFADGYWHHAVVTYAGTSLASGVKIYVDGVEEVVVVETNNLSSTILTTASFIVGVRFTTTLELPFEGPIDDVAVYNAVLTAANVTTIYNGGTPPDLTVVGPTGSLVGYWKMGDGATFPTIPDDSVNSNAGTMTNMEAGDIVADAPTSTPVAASTLSTLFGGTDEHGLIGDVTPLQFERTDSFSISAWVKTTATATQTIFGKMLGTTTFRGYNFRLLNTPAGVLQMQIISDNGAANLISLRTTSAVANDGLWHHVCVTYAGTSTTAGIKLYIDGAIPSSTVVSAGPVTATILGGASAAIGARINAASDSFFVGNIDEVAVYNKALTGLEVLAIFNGMMPNDLRNVGPTQNLVGWWRMGEGAAFPSIPDDSVNSNAAALTNMESGDIETDAPPVTEVLVAFSESSVTVRFFRMRALDDPGPGYVTWVVQDNPDPAGTFAPGPIIAGTATIDVTWLDLP
jgi:hypothetical protein